MKAARITLLIAIILGSIAIGILSYGIGGKEYFDSNGDQVFYADSNDEYETTRSFRSGENFSYGFLGGVALLAPIIIGIYMSIRREWIDQRKLARKHPWNIWISVNSIIAILLLCSSVYSFDHYSWGRMGFGETLLAFVLFYYVSIIPTAGAIGFLLVFDLPKWEIYGIVGIIGTYSIFIAGYYHTRYVRKQRENWVREFMQHCPRGSEIPIHEMGLVFLMSPVKMRSVLMKMIKKDKIQCSILNWMLKILESYRGEIGGPATRDIDGVSDSILQMGVPGKGWVGYHSTIEETHRSEETDYCFRCGNPLHGKTHCSQCGYRSRFSYYNTMEPRYSTLTLWVSSLRGGIDPMRNALLLLIAATIGFTFIVGGISYLVSDVTDQNVWGPLVDSIYGMFGGAALSPFVFIPVYLMVRKEIEHQRRLQLNEPIMIMLWTHAIITVLIFVSAFANFVLTPWSHGLGEITLGSVIIFYLSVVSGSISTFFYISYWISEDSDQVWVGLIQLIATYLYYGGLVYAWSRKKQDVKNGKKKGMRKWKKEEILKYLSTHDQGEELPLHVLGRIVRMEPVRVRSFLRKLIIEGHIHGIVSEYHLKLYGPQAAFSEKR